jgi:prepilin-type N-terminal cleavage/methylation domain-containing protein
MGGGFTLAELMAVMVITSVLVAAAVPTLNSFGDTRAAAAGKQILRDLSFARQNAMATGTVNWIVFDASAESWRIMVEDPATPGRANRIALVDPATNSDHLTAINAGAFAGVEISTASFDGNPEVSFDWLGQPFNQSETALAATGVVTLTGGHLVNVHVASGRAEYVGP